MRTMRWKIKLNKEIFPITSGHETSLNPVIKRLCELEFYTQELTGIDSCFVGVFLNHLTPMLGKQVDQNITKSRVTKHLKTFPESHSGECFHLKNVSLP